MREIGNAVAKEKWEKCLPPSNRPCFMGDDPVLREQWIRAKYEVCVCNYDGRSSGVRKEATESGKEKGTQEMCAFLYEKGECVGMCVCVCVCVIC